MTDVSRETLKDLIWDAIEKALLDIPPTAIMCATANVRAVALRNAINEYAAPVWDAVERHFPAEAETYHDRHLAAVGRLEPDVTEINGGDSVLASIAVSLKRIADVMCNPVITMNDDAVGTVPDTTPVVIAAVDRAVLREREACAALAEGLTIQVGDGRHRRMQDGHWIGNMIRNRGETT